jgi:hypothetical protein
MQYHQLKLLSYLVDMHDKLGKILRLHSPNNHGTKNDSIPRFNHSALHHAKKLHDEWFSELDIIHGELMIHYKHDITEKETFSHIICNLKPKMYESTLSLDEDPNYVPNLHSLKRDIRRIYTRSKSTNVTTHISGEMISAAIQSKSEPKFRSSSNANAVCVVIRVIKHLTVGKMKGLKTNVLQIIQRRNLILLLHPNIFQKISL